jgi:DMSO reductase family type II enzyme heme b subunit
MASSRHRVLLLAGAILWPGLAGAQDFAERGFKLAPTSPRQASSEDLAAGQALYAENCSQCHGDQGDGQGVLADLLDPRPRDFTRGIYKIRRTPQGELPTDEDLFRIISLGMPGTSMPAWQGVLSDPQIWQLVGVIKSFSPDFADYPAEKQFALEGRIEASAESLKRGAEVYEKAECAKCHGVRGRGNGRSAGEQEDEWGFKIHPADLTQPWRLRGGASVEDLYRTVTTGVNGTPMPSFSDAWSSEDLWHLANYLHSLGREPSFGEILRGVKTDAVPQDPDAPAWDQAPLLDVRLAGQVIQDPRLFNPSVRSLSVQALFDEQELALRLTWNDRFENQGEGEEPADRVAVLFSARELPEGKKPYFLMGDRQRPVDTWQWSAAPGVETFLARGTDAVVPRASPVQGQGTYEDGQYRVVLRRRLRAGQDDEVGFSPGQMIPIAWNVWDGQNGEVGRQRAISRWYYLLLEPETPLSTYFWPLAVVFLAAGGEGIGLRALRRRWASEAQGTPDLRDLAESLAGGEAPE